MIEFITVVFQIVAMIFGGCLGILAGILFCEWLGID